MLRCHTGEEEDEDEEIYWINSLLLPSSVDRSIPFNGSRSVVYIRHYYTGSEVPFTFASAQLGRSLGSFVLGLIRKILKLMKISRCSCNRLSDVSFYCLLITIIVPLRPPPNRRRTRGRAHMIGKHNPNNLIEIRSQRTNRTCNKGDDKMGTL